MITIDEIMTPKPFSLAETDTIGDARRLMTDKNIRHVPITDPSKKLVGLVTQRDILAATAPSSDSAGQEDTRLGDIMIRNVNVIGESDSVRLAAMHLQKHKYGCMPVVANGVLVGIITDSDFIGIAINLIEQIEAAEDQADFDDVDDFDSDVMDDFDFPVQEDF